MLTRQTFARRFGSRPLFGMVHLAPLPGAPLYGGSIDRVLELAIADATAIADGGCDGLLIENFGDRPFYGSCVPSETIAAMTRVIAGVMREVRLPFGVNVLRNDASSALAIAAATGAAFIRINVHTGTMFTDQGVLVGDAAATLRRRAMLVPDTAIFADHLVKHAVPPAGIDPVQSARDLRLRGLADALIVSGSETGAAPDAARLVQVRGAVDAPVLIGSGLTVNNVRLYADADGAIAGTSIKREGCVDQPVDRARVAALVKAFKRSGEL